MRSIQIPTWFPKPPEVITMRIGEATNELIVERINLYIGEDDYDLELECKSGDATVIIDFSTNQWKLLYGEGEAMDVRIFSKGHEIIAKINT